jgi:pimeloyl-ACP methyl ester carboxylesterase
MSIETGCPVGAARSGLPLGDRAAARARGHAASALRVVLSTLRLAPAGPRAPRAAVEHLRRSMWVGPPLNAMLSWLEAGRNAPARVILVHGTPGEAAGWADYLLATPPAFELIALDRPGFGASAPRAAVVSLRAQAAAVAALLPADGRKAVLVGHSLGGPIVARVAAEHPDRVHGLVLLAAAFDPALERIHALQRLGAWPPVRALLPRAIRNANEELLALEGELRELAADLGRIVAPTVVVHGTRDALVPYANVAFLHRRLTRVRSLRTVTLASRDHFLPWNCGREVWAAIAAVAEAAR